MSDYLDHIETAEAYIKALLKGKTNEEIKAIGTNLEIRYATLLLFGPETGERLNRVLDQLLYRIDAFNAYCEDFNNFK